jgi:TolA-binding protein
MRILRGVTQLSLAAVLLAGCAMGGADSATDAAASGAGGGYAVDEAGGETASGAGTAADDRQVITEGSIQLTVDDPRAAAQEAALLVEHVGGHVQERTEQAGSGEGDGGSATLTVRVPSTELTRVLQQLEQLGTVESVEIMSTDVTAQGQDLDARVRALQLSVTRLEDLLARAQTTTELVAAEQTLTERQAELESLQSQRARLADRVEMSTVRLMLWTDGAAPEVAPAGFLGGLRTGWDSLVTAIGAALLVAGVLVPWLAFLAVVVALALWLRSRMRRQVTTASLVAPSDEERAGAPSGAAAHATGPSGGTDGDGRHPTG